MGPAAAGACAAGGSAPRPLTPARSRRPAQHPELVPLTLVDFDYLINKKKVEEEDDFMTLVNETTKWAALLARGCGGPLGAWCRGPLLRGG